MIFLCACSSYVVRKLIALGRIKAKSTVHMKKAKCIMDPALKRMQHASEVRQQLDTLARLG